MSALQTTSPKGRAFLKVEEGEVLRTYRDVVGVKTIGVGLTAASGVIVPKMGMTITREQSDALLTKALARNYEPRVRKALPNVHQHEFDAGVSFDWNTGAIDKASWVKVWPAKNWDDIERRFKMWVKAGGRRIRALVLRRDREFQLMRFGVYEGVAETEGLTVENVSPVARLIFPQGVQAVKGLQTASEVKAALVKLGYGNLANARVMTGDVCDFQRDHDLTTDGIVGPATLNTIQRQLDARRKLAQTAASAGAGGAVEAAPTVDTVPLPDGAGIVIIGVAALIACYLLWQYRDWVAAKITRRLPGLAAKLRSF